MHWRIRITDPFIVLHEMTGKGKTRVEYLLSNCSTTSTYQVLVL